MCLESFLFQCSIQYVISVSGTILCKVFVYVELSHSQYYKVRPISDVYFIAMKCIVHVSY